MSPQAMPCPVADDIQQLWHDGKLYWLRITVTAEPAEVPDSWPWFPMRTDLGGRIADLIRSDCEGSR